MLLRSCDNDTECLLITILLHNRRLVAARHCCSCNIISEERYALAHLRAREKTRAQCSPGMVQKRMGEILTRM